MATDVSEQHIVFIFKDQAVAVQEYFLKHGTSQNRATSHSNKCLYIKLYFLNMNIVQMSLFLVNPLNTKLYLSELKIQSVPRSKLSASVFKTDKLYCIGK